MSRRQEAAGDGGCGGGREGDVQRGVVCRGGWRLSASLTTTTTAGGQGGGEAGGETGLADRYGSAAAGCNKQAWGCRGCWGCWGGPPWDARETRLASDRGGLGPVG